MKAKGFHLYSHLPLAGTPLSREFTEVIGVREEVVDRFDKRPKPLPYLVILYTEAGEGLNRAGESRTTYRAGSLVVQPRGLVYGDRTVRLPWRMRYLLLVGPMADAFTAAYWQHRELRTRIYSSPPPVWTKWLIELVELTFDQPPLWPWRFMRHLGELFEALLASPPPDVPHADLLDRVRRLIQSDLSNPWRLEDLSAALRIDAKTLSRHFHRAADASPAAWVRRQRMAMAIKYLHQGMSVIDTANQLGFDDPSRFSRQFKAVTGAPPSAVHRAAPQRP